MESNALSIGSLLKHGEYCITGVLGQGGFGITYQAEQVSLGRKVAVKEFFMKEYCERDGSTSHVTLGTSSGSKELVEKFRQKFVREARMIAGLDQEHIIKIHDVFEENGTAYYVMEYLDGGFKTKDVKSDWPNDYGLYQMAGNVAEWVMDVYRQSSHDDVTEYNPFRGNYFETKKLLEDGTVAERDSVGKIPMVPVSDFKNDRRRNYRAADNKNYRDGDWQSLKSTDDWKTATTNTEATERMYRKEINNNYSYSLVSDYARVYKGGSWKDIPYWSSPGSRRYLDEDESTDYIGFRCAMARVGTQSKGK